jgi:hypothetical protein
MGVKCLGEDEGGRLLRMVRWHAMMMDAQRLRNPFDQDPDEALSRTIHMGDGNSARKALVKWAREAIQELRARPKATRRQWKSLRATYTEMAAKIDGRLSIMPTELGYYSQNVAPDFGKQMRTYAGWATPRRLEKVFQEGHELLIQGHMGTGKTHLAVLLMEQLLALQKTTFVVITNVSGVQDPAGTYSPRIHHISLLSEILRIWTELPEETKIFLVIDEPESNLRGGSSKGVKAYQDFRYMIRKLGIAKAEIWHNISEQYKSIREDDSESVFRIMKDTQASFDYTRNIRGETITQRIQGVPGIARLQFATRGIGSIDVDVNMAVLIRRIAKLHVLSDIKAEVRAALDDPRTMLGDYRDEDALKAEEAAAQAAREEDWIVQILAEPSRFLDSRGAVDVDKLRRAFHVTYRDAQHLAEQAEAKLPRAPEEDVNEKLVVEILRRREEFLGKRGTGFDREKIMRLLNVSDRHARHLQGVANQRAGFTP